MTAAIVITLNLVALTLIGWRVTAGCRHCRKRWLHGDSQPSRRPVRGHLWLWQQQIKDPKR